MEIEERRSSPRLEVIDELHGRLVAFDVLTLREVSAGGFSTDGPLHFPKGAEHLFRFVTAGGIDVLLRATVVHTRPAGKDQSSPRFVTGFRFLQDATDETAVKIAVLLGALAAAREFKEDTAERPTSLRAFTRLKRV